VKIGAELLVMLDNEIVRLTGIGPAVWQACAGPVGLDELMDHVGKVHGEPEGYRAAVATAVEHLIAKSVLKRGEK
jgi:hypothetical protein